MSLKERLEWVIRNRSEQISILGKNGKPTSSARSWSIKAGYTHNLVNNIKRGVSKRPAAQTFSDLARVAGVSSLWLADDTGGPLDVIIDPERTTDRYPSRATVVQLLKDEPHGPAVIAKLLLLNIYDADPGLATWMRAAATLMEEEENRANVHGHRRQA